MPAVDNQGVRIHYEVEGAGPPLVIQHGLSDSLETWREYGYVDALTEDYQVVLVDGRGHGKSDKPHESAAYRLPRCASDVVAVLDALHIRTAHFFGYSWGARIGFALAKEAPTRVSSMVLGGSPPIGPAKAGIWDADPWVPVLQKGAEAIAPTLWDAEVSDALRARIDANDVDALLAVRTMLAEETEMQFDLASMTMPCLLFVGERDAGNLEGVRETAARIAQSEFVALPEQTQIGTLLSADIVLPHLTRFLFRVAQP